MYTFISIINNNKNKRLASCVINIILYAFIKVFNKSQFNAFLTDAVTEEKIMIL